MARLTFAFAGLRWRLLQGSLRGAGSERIGVIASTTASMFVAVVGGLGLALGGRAADDPTALVAVVMVTSVGLAVGLGIVSGVSQPIDPRVLAVEPISERRRAVGLLAATAVGPPGLAGVAVGLGLAVATARSLVAVPVVAAAIVAWLLVLLVAARTATNLLGLLLDRRPRTGQLVVGLGGVALYVALQIGPLLVGRLGPAGRERLGDVLAWNPVGQLARAATTAGSAGSLGHLAIGVVALPPLFAIHLASTARLATSVRSTPARRARRRRTGRAVGLLVRRACGRGAVGAVAWRCLVTRVRTPRTAIETVLGAAIGLAAVLAPVLFRDGFTGVGVGGGAVLLVGGAVQLAVLFMSGNAFGNAGPALTGELLAADPRVVVRGTARSIALAGSPLVVGGPVVAAALTGAWGYLPAGLLVALGALWAGTGGATVQSALVPIAMPESDDPFAHGETGRGLTSAALLVAVVSVLALVALPLSLVLVATADSLVVTTLLAAAAVALGRAVLAVGVALATVRVRNHTPELVVAVTPSR